AVHVGLADRVLLDAPCSGLGVIRQKPDIRYNRTEANITELSVLQSNLIKSAAVIVKPSGRLVYSVCTMEKEETTDVIHRFLAENTDFAVVEPPAILQGRISDDGYGYAFWPHRDLVDGFYVAMLQRKGI
ncbi:MAG: hypothetical protein Q8N36_00500, partial [bacterium]|nr:hypothetical protein [bacterium]